MIALLVAHVQHGAGARSTAAVTTAQFREVADETDDEAGDVTTRAALTPTIRKRFDDRADRMKALLGELDRSGVEIPELPGLHRSVDSYVDIVHDHFAWVDRTDPNAREGEVHYDSRVDDGFEAMIARPEPIMFRLTAQARSATRRADLFTTLFIPFAALLLAIALGRAEGRRRQLEVAAAEQRQNERFAALLHNSADLVSVTDEHSRIDFCTAPATVLLGQAPEDAQGSLLAGFVDERARVTAAIAAASDSNGPVPAELRIPRPDGTHVRLRGSCLDRRDDPTIGGFIWNLRDVTAECELENQLIHQALHDPLTGAANRRLFVQRAADSLSVALRDDTSMALLLLDVDNFKYVNDTHGHHVGDAVLVAIAERAAACIRPTDTLARIGGDEFAIVLETAGEADAASVVARITEALQAPLTVGGAQLVPAASIGYAVRDAETVDFEDLQQAADASMYHAKSRRRPRGRGTDSAAAA